MVQYVCTLFFPLLKMNNSYVNFYYFHKCIGIGLENPNNHSIIFAIYLYITREGPYVDITMTRYETLCKSNVCMGKSLHIWEKMIISLINNQSIRRFEEQLEPRQPQTI